VIFYNIICQTFISYACKGQNGEEDTFVTARQWLYTNVQKAVNPTLYRD